MFYNPFWNCAAGNPRQGGQPAQDCQNSHAAQNKCYRTDYGPEPFVVNIEEATESNRDYRVALWTGKHLQLTLMCINPGEDIGLEVHSHLDQFLRIESGAGVVKMGETKDRADFQAHVYPDCAIFVPAGKWHNIINTGNRPIKLYSIYAPPEHRHGTIQETRRKAEFMEQ